MGFLYPNLVRHHRCVPSLVFPVVFSPPSSESSLPKGLDPRNARRCVACGRWKHLKHFPLEESDNPANSERLLGCEPCFRSALNRFKRTPEFKRKCKDFLNREWRHYRTAAVAKRRSIKLRATPRWADYGEILAIYEKARRMTEETGIQHHVDHIVPLIHPKVCGLHVHGNLQVLTATENCSKSNKFEIG